MGLIKAAIGAIGGTLHDSWLDAIKCEDFDNSTLMIKKTTDNSIISRGSKIIVNPGQVALIVDTGKVLDASAEPGAFTFDASASPSLFAGDFGASFEEMWERFSFGGKPAKEQAVYFINTKEIVDNKFGTPAPIPYKDWGHPNFNPRTNSMYAMAVNIKAFGSYTFKVTDPFKFMSEIAGTATRYTKDLIGEQMKSEFIAAFRNTLSELGGDAYKVEAMDLPNKDDEILKAMAEKKYDSRITDRGLAIVSVAVESVKLDEESERKIHDYELSDAYTQSGYLAGATGHAMEAAAANPNGSVGAFMGMGMAQNAGMQNNMLGQMMQNQQAQTAQMAQQQAQPAQTVQTAQAARQAEPQVSAWVCDCGEKNNTGKFCQNCGKAMPQAIWDCKCGHKANTGKFCSECGAPRG